MRKIKLTPTEIVKVQDETGWTPFWFETNHGIVTIPGPTDDYYEPYDDDTLSCGCCSCCGCMCWYDEIDDEEDNE